MQKNITLKSTRMIAKLMMSFVLMICLGSTSFAQTTITTTYVNNNGFSLVTFNFVNNNPNPVMITSIGSISSGAGAQTATLYYKATPINGLPPAINPANGWNTVATGTFTPPGATVTPFLTGLTFQVPANTTYGFAIETASLAYSSLVAGAGISTTSGGGCSIVTGDNIGYGGAAAPASPTNTPRGFIGFVTFSNVATTPCTGTPAPGNTVASATTACGGTTVNLSTQNPTVGMGVTYQWQSSPNAGGPFTNIAGATTPNYTATVNASLYYQVVVTCATTSTSGTSNPVLVSLTPASGCYCASNATTTADEDLFNVTLGTLNNTSNCTSVVTGTGSVINQYSNYTNGTTAVAAPTLIAGATYPMSVSAGTCGGNYGNGIAVFIDFNQNGSFLDAGEKVYGGGTTTGPHTETFNIVVPVGAVNGTTRMRVIDVEGTAGSGITPCLTYLWGETEDYNVTIAPCTPVLITGSPASATVACGGNATFTATATGSQPAYQWQYRPNATAVWLPVPNAAPYSGVNTATLTVTGVTPALSGYQYRAVVTGACAGPDFTQPATLTVGPFVYTVTPTSYNVCTTGGVPALISFPSSTSTATFTNNTPFAIPDASATGASSGIAVSGIPVGAVIQRIAVTFNLTHTYVGDVVVNLKSPLATATTGILNLVGFLDGGTGSNGTANFVNTVVASDGTLAMSGAPAPRTNTFKADALLITGGPTGGVANVTNWSTLTGVANANGIWTLYGADGFAGDVGTVTSWSISITYVASSVTASFTPTTGLYTNAAATTPYTGGQVAQVYALPTTVGPNVYSAVVSTPSCTAAPQNITVNVNAPVTGPAVVANVNSCVGSNATFSVTGITGGPIYTYQWQVSTAAVPAFTNIPGATSATYTVTGAALAQSGNQYRVIITGAGCAATTSITSSAGTLAVNTVPVVVISSSPGTTVSPTPANSVTLTAAVSSATGPIQYQWFRNNVAIAGANAVSFTTNTAGSYSVTVTDANGCSTATSSPLNITITSAPNANLFIYPSPNNGSFLVRYYNRTASATITEYATVNVYDGKGSRVYTRRFPLNSAYTAMRVVMEAHGRGIYRVDLVNDNGERLQTGSVMIF